MEIIFEIILQLIFEIFAEMVEHKVAKKYNRKRASPLMAGLGYILMGAIAGGLSLLIMPHSLINDETLRIANLMITPVMAGIVMATIGRWRDNRDQDLMRLDHFWYGYLFALSMAVVRFVWVG